jgi:hypothetical protein
MPQPNQLFVRREDVVVTGRDLLSMSGVAGGGMGGGGGDLLSMSGVAGGGAGMGGGD